MVQVYYHIICWVVIVECVYSQYVGDFCTIQSTGQSGQCQVITKCPSAVQALQSQGIFPQICGFQGPDSIVCCAGSTPNPTPTPATPRPTPTPTRPRPTPTPTPATMQPTVKNPVILRVGDKSRAKCKEYEKYVFEYAVANGPPTSECVISSVNLIVGGEKAKLKEFPHMALIGFEDANKDKKWQCGGSLISEQFVLTAGHCLFDRELGDAKFIKIGDLVINDNTDGARPQDFNIIERIRHPSYRPPAQYNDIALIKLDRKAKLDSYARPACINTNPTIDVTKKPVASGWGKVGFTSDTSATLLKVTLEYFTNAECNTSYRNNIGLRLRNGIVDQTQLCAGSHSESKDTCQGDSGGPLQVVLDKKACMYHIVGVTSFGKACGVANIPGVYTRVSSYIEWIEGVVWP